VKSVELVLWIEMVKKRKDRGVARAVVMDERDDFLPGPWVVVIVCYLDKSIGIILIQL